MIWCMSAYFFHSSTKTRICFIKTKSGSSISFTDFRIFVNRSGSIERKTKKQIKYNFRAFV